MGRSIETVYVYSCDSPPACDTVLQIHKGEREPLWRSTGRPIQNADDADDAVRNLGWYFRGRKAFCPRHVMVGGR